MLSLHSLQRKQKNYSNPFRIRTFLFLSLLIWNCNDQYVHTLRRFLENHTRFQTKMGKMYTRFQTKTAQKPYPMGRHIPIWLYGLYKGVPPWVSSRCPLYVLFVYSRPLPSNLVKRVDFTTLNIKVNWNSLRSSNWESQEFVLVRFLLVWPLYIP